MTGNEVYFIDAGVTVADKREQPIVGGTDDRAGFKVTTAHPDDLKLADVIILHTGIPDEWLSGINTPIVWIIHARPLAAFRPDQNRGLKSFFYASVMKNPQIKKIVYFWPEYRPFWKIVMPEEKMHIFDFPMVDQFRFRPDGEKHLIEQEHLGKYNGLICDSWREDVDVYETVCGAIEAARDIPGLKWHLYAFENPIPECWAYLIDELKRLGAMGELCSRMPDMEKVYRSFDFLLTPHRIVTRVIGEALSCGLPVIAANDCKVAQETADISDPYSVADAVKRMVNKLSDSAGSVRGQALFESKKFNLAAFGAQMNGLYKEITG
jgi:glycosyltransferase involved in cell wall biosynthesis